MALCKRNMAALRREPRGPRARPLASGRQRARRGSFGSGGPPPRPFCYPSRVAADRRPLRPVHVALLLALAAAVAAVLLPGRRTREDPADVLRALRAARGPTLPAPAVVGAAGATPAARYAKDTLAEVIDGAAEAYLRNGFVSAVMATYAFDRGGAPLEVAAEAHRFERDAGARAQAAAEAPPRAAPVEGVPEAASDGAVLLAVAGRDLLKLTLLSPGEGGPEALAEIAGAWRREQAP